jgi:hypothetical protein
MATTTIRNWDGSQTWRPEQIHRPADEAAIIELIVRAAGEGKRLKPVGSAVLVGHCRYPGAGHAIRQHGQDP